MSSMVKIWWKALQNYHTNPTPLTTPPTALHNESCDFISNLYMFNIPDHINILSIFRLGNPFSHIFCYILHSADILIL